MKKFLSFITLLLFVTVLQSQTILVFKPNSCIVSEGTKDVQVKHQSAFGFDFKSKTIYYSDSFTEWTEKIVSDTVVYVRDYEYKTIEFYTETSKFELWLYPNDGEITLRPQQLFEYPLGGPIDTRQYYFSKLKSK